MKPTADQARSIMSYDPDTGLFIRKLKTSNRVKVGDILGCPDGAGYLQIGIFGKVYRSHRLAWLVMTGEWPKEQIDHINGVRDDNRWCNLRSVSHSENGKNKATPSRNTSGVIGVFWDKRDRKWRSEINVDGKKISLGYFSEFSSAVVARKSAEHKYDYHPNHGRAMI